MSVKKIFKNVILIPNIFFFQLIIISEKFRDISLKMYISNVIKYIKYIE